jgi:hypothetical protein
MSESSSDLLISNHGSICLLRSGTDAGKQWLQQHVHQDAETQYWGHSIVVEPRYLADILTGARDDGLSWGNF